MTLYSLFAEALSAKKETMVQFPHLRETAFAGATICRTDTTSGSAVRSANWN
jgi:hypothetical protein